MRAYNIKKQYNSLDIKVTVSGFVTKNVVFFISAVIALITCLFVPIDRGYIDYFDVRTLTCLFVMLLVVSALKNIYFFRILAGKLIKIFSTARSITLALVFITYIASMLIANDMALVTFLPLSIMVLKAANRQKDMPFVFIMQTIGANLGGMLTPFGNPQNLYLYNYFNINTGEFFMIMLAPFLIAIVLIVACCFFVKNEKLQPIDNCYNLRLDRPRTIVYGIMFIYSILIVFRVVPFWSGFLLLPALFVCDRKAFLGVDYILLLTFCMFFVFSGNLARIDAVRELLMMLMSKSTLLTGVISCQIISNVPSGVLLSNFTTNYAELLMAVNIGGCGTLISSLASLITFKQFVREQPKAVKKYLVMFHVINFSFLIVLTAACFALTLLS